MAFRRDFGTDPLTGAKQFFVIDEQDPSKFSIETVEDIEPILAANYEARKEEGPIAGSWDRNGETFRHFARIPNSILYNEHILPRWIRHDTKELVKWLQRPEQEALRTKRWKFV